MQLLDEHNLAPYLHELGVLTPGEVVEIRELTGGVSNAVFYAGRDATVGEDIVVKQARGKLRVPQEWLCSVERIWRECDVMRVCGDVFANKDAPANQRNIRAPSIVFEDRPNYALGMSAVPWEHYVWKQRLLAGEAEQQLARDCGRMLGELHAGTWGDAALAVSLGDRRYFETLRVDPYYRQIARIHPEIAPQVGQLLCEMEQRSLCLVHGDFSPKNLLVTEAAVTLVDFEVGHFGDPCFDLGFFLSHLVLKAIYHAPQYSGLLGLSNCFLSAYAHVLRDRLSDNELQLLDAGTPGHLLGCLLARIDGKSPVEYLNPRQQQFARRASLQLLGQAPAGCQDVLEAIRSYLAEGVET